MFTGKRYADKNRQEKLISASELEWTIVRPAPFSKRRVPGSLEIHKTLLPGTVLRRVTRDEVAHLWWTSSIATTTCTSGHSLAIPEWPGIP